MDWKGRRAVTAVVVMLYVYHIRSQCIEFGNAVLNCPDPLQTAIVSSSSDGLSIGGLFSNSRYKIDAETTRPFCTRCQGASNNSLQHRFAVEQAEALLYAIDVIESELGYPVGHSIMDTCGFSEELEGVTADFCYREQVRRYRNLQSVLATIVGPYYAYQKHPSSDSMSESEFVDLTRILAAQIAAVQSDSPPDSRGMLSLLDLPFLSSDTVESLLPEGFTERFAMLQQTCELQALVAVDFLAQEGWGNVTVVASSDSCGGKSLLEVHNHIQRKKMGCHFNVCHV